MRSVNVYPQAVLKKNDTKAYWLIGIFSVIVFCVVTLLNRTEPLKIEGFDVHILSAANAVINSVVSILLILALVAVKQRKLMLHKNIMLTAMALSVLFLLCYIGYHLFTKEVLYGDTNKDFIVDTQEKAAAGTSRIIYFIILGTHILFAGLVMPFVLWSAYKGLTGEYAKHKKISKYTWPIWFYVAVTGPVVYFMISKYY